MKPPYRCKFCGAPSWIEPSEQTMPPDYCHPEDHGQDLEAVAIMVGIVGDVIRQMGRVRSEDLLAGIQRILPDFTETDHRDVINAMHQEGSIQISVDGFIEWIGPL